MDDFRMYEPVGKGRGSERSLVAVPLAGPSQSQDQPSRDRLGSTVPLGSGQHALPHKVLMPDTGTTAFSSHAALTWSPQRVLGDSISSLCSSSRNDDGHMCSRWSGDASVDHFPLRSPSSLSQATLEACDSDDAFVEDATITCWLQPPPAGVMSKPSAFHGSSSGSSQDFNASVSSSRRCQVGTAETSVACADWGHGESVDMTLRCMHHASGAPGDEGPCSAASCPVLTPPARLPVKHLRRAQSDLLALSLTSQFSALTWDEHSSAMQGSGGCAAAGSASELLQQHAAAEAERRLYKLHRRGSWSSAHNILVTDGDNDNGETRHRTGCLGSGVADLSGASSAPAVMLRSRSNYHLTNRHATVELFLRLNHARQTLDFVKKQASSFSALNKSSLNVWEALSQLNELNDYEATLMRHDLSPEMPLLAHAFQTAELCRLRHPNLDWLHLVGLIHGLGKLLAHGRWGSQPQWAISGESFPVGCRFSTQVEGAEFFMANPDRRRRQLNTPCGMYAEHCGLTNVYMSWSAAEYLYLVLALNDTSLPPEALFIVRHQKFWTLSAGGGDGYAQLLSPDDARMLPLLAEFQQLSRYHDEGQLPAGALQGSDLRKYYGGLIAKYLGGGKLSW